MAFWYMDTDASDDLQDGTTWANAVKVFETALALMAAGDILFVQGAATDTSSSTRTYTSPGTVGRPCIFIGVVNGTTNTGTSVVVSDLASTLPHIETTGVNTDVTFGGIAVCQNLHFTIADRPAQGPWTYIDCKYTFADRATLTATKLVFINSVVETTNGNAQFTPTGNGAAFEMYGGSFLGTADPGLIFRFTSTGLVYMNGVDLSDLTTIAAPIVYPRVTTSVIVPSNVPFPYPLVITVRIAIMLP